MSQSKFHLVCDELGDCIKCFEMPSEFRRINEHHFCQKHKGLTLNYHSYIYLLNDKNILNIIRV